MSCVQDSMAVAVARSSLSQQDAVWVTVVHFCALGGFLLNERKVTSRVFCLVFSEIMSRSVVDFRLRRSRKGSVQ